MDKLYQKYVDAREYAWSVHDDLVEIGVTDREEIYADPLYKRACEDENDAFSKWLKARDKEGDLCQDHT